LNGEWKEGKRRRKGWISLVADMSLMGGKKLTFAISLPHDHRAHEDLNGPDAVQDNLALSSGLVHAKCSTKLVLTNGTCGIDFVAQHEERRLGQLLHLQEGLTIQRMGKEEAEEKERKKRIEIKGKIVRKSSKKKGIQIGTPQVPSWTPGIARGQKSRPGRQCR